MLDFKTILILPITFINFQTPSHYKFHQKTFYQYNLFYTLFYFRPILQAGNRRARSCSKDAIKVGNRVIVKEKYLGKSFSQNSSADYIFLDNAISKF